MLRLTLIFAAISVTREVYSIPVQELDLKDILQFAQIRDNYQNRKYKDNKKYQNSNNNYGSLKNEDIAELMQKVTDDRLLSNDQDEKREYRDANELLNELNNNYKKSKHNKMTFGHYLDKNKDFDKNIVENDGDNEFNDNDERYKHSRFNEQALDELLSRNVVNKNLKSKSKSLIVPSSVVESYEFNNNRNDDNNEDEYSRIYVVLNPQAIEKSENKEKLNNLLARVLSLTSLAQETNSKKRSKAQRYEGFSVGAESLARRSRHDSRENSMEDDYKPKRVRDRGSGGVGGAGGRTAIPYIRNRGDIYERDH